MNFLAHAYLSFNHPEILLGNMISDFVKGKKQFDYPDLVQKGIKLHRSIDAFTDTHPATKAMREIFKTAYGAYSGAFADVVYDYFLANDIRIFHDEKALSDFAGNTYQMLSSQSHWFPEYFVLVFENMQRQNWLLNYGRKWGIEKSFGGLVRRAKYLEDVGPAKAIFEKNMEAFRQYYDDFIPFIQEHALQKCNELLNIET